MLDTRVEDEPHRVGSVEVSRIFVMQGNFFDGMLLPEEVEQHSSYELQTLEWIRESASVDFKSQFHIVLDIVIDKFSLHLNTNVISY